MPVELPEAPETEAAGTNDIIVQVPGLGRVKFPAGTSPDTIRSVVESHLKPQTSNAAEALGPPSPLSVIPQGAQDAGPDNVPYGGAGVTAAPQLGPSPRGEPGPDFGTDPFSPIMKGVGTVAAQVGNIPVDVFNTASRMTGHTTQLPRFEPGKASVTFPEKAGIATLLALTPITAPLAPLVALMPEEKIPAPIRGLGKAVADTESGFTTPENLALLPFAATKPVQALFAAQMLTSTPGQVKQTIEVLRNPNTSTEQKWEAMGDTGIHLAFTTALALHISSDAVKAQYSPEQAAAISKMKSAEADATAGTLARPINITTEDPNALSIGSTTTPVVGKAPGSGPEVGQGVPGAEEPAVPQGATPVSSEKPVDKNAPTKAQIKTGDIEAGINKFLADNGLHENTFDNDQRLVIHNLVRATFGNLPPEFTMSGRTFPGLLAHAMTQEPFLSFMKAKGLLPDNWNPLNGEPGRGFGSTIERAEPKAEQNPFSKEDFRRASEHIKQEQAKESKFSKEEFLKQMQSRISNSYAIPLDHFIRVANQHPEIWESATEAGFVVSPDGKWLVRAAGMGGNVPASQQQNQQDKLVADLGEKDAFARIAQIDRMFQEVMSQRPLDQRRAENLLSEKQKLLNAIQRARSAPATPATAAPAPATVAKAPETIQTLKPGQPVKPGEKVTMSFEDFVPAFQRGDFNQVLDKVPTFKVPPDQQMARGRYEKALEVLRENKLDWAIDLNTPEKAAKAKAMLDTLPKDKLALIKTYQLAKDYSDALYERNNAENNRNKYDALVDAGVIVRPAETAKPAAVTKPAAAVSESKPVAKPVKPVSGSAIRQVPEPSTFNSVDDLLKFRQSRLREERQLYQEQMGITEQQAAKLQDILAREASTSRFEKELTPDQLARFNAFFDGPLNQRGGPFKSIETDPRLNPEEISKETDVESLASALVSAVNRGVESNPNSDRFMSAVIASIRLKELRATKADIARYLDKYTTRESSSQGDKVEFFKSLGAKVNNFLESHGIRLDTGEITAAKALSEPDRKARIASLEKELTELGKKSIEDRVEQLSVEGMVAREIADELGIKVSQVNAIRKIRGIPPRDNVEKFGAWQKAKREEVQHPLQPAYDVANHPLDKPWDKGGSVEAIRFGASMDPSRIQDFARLLSLRSDAYFEYESLPQVTPEDGGRLNVAYQKFHWLDEAVEGATGVGKTPDQILPPDYKPPFAGHDQAQLGPEGEQTIITEEMKQRLIAQKNAELADLTKKSKRDYDIGLNKYLNYRDLERVHQLQSDIDHLRTEGEPTPWPKYLREKVWDDVNPPPKSPLFKLMKLSREQREDFIDLWRKLVNRDVSEAKLRKVAEESTRADLIGNMMETIPFGERAKLAREHDFHPLNEQIMSFDEFKVLHGRGMLVPEAGNITTDQIISGDYASAPLRHGLLVAERLAQNVKDPEARLHRIFDYLVDKGYLVDSESGAGIRMLEEQAKAKADAEANQKAAAAKRESMTLEQKQAEAAAQYGDRTDLFYLKDAPLENVNEGDIVRRRRKDGSYLYGQIVTGVTGRPEVEYGGHGNRMRESFDVDWRKSNDERNPLPERPYTKEQAVDEIRSGIGGKKDEIRAKVPQLLEQASPGLLDRATGIIKQFRDSMLQDGRDPDVDQNHADSHDSRWIASKSLLAEMSNLAKAEWESLRREKTGRFAYATPAYVSMFEDAVKTKLEAMERHAKDIMGPGRVPIKSQLEQVNALIKMGGVVADSQVLWDGNTLDALLKNGYQLMGDKWVKTSMAGPGSPTPAEIGEDKTDIQRLEDSMRTLAEAQKKAGNKPQLRRAYTLGQRLSRAKDRASKALDGLKTAGAWLWKLYNGNPNVGGIFDAIGERHVEMSEIKQNAQNYHQTTNQAIPKELDRGAINVWIDMGGNKDAIREARQILIDADKGQDEIRYFDRALELNPEEQVIAENHRNYFDSKLDRAIEAGFLRENAITKRRAFEAELDDSIRRGMTEEEAAAKREAFEAELQKDVDLGVLNAGVENFLHRVYEDKLPREEEKFLNELNSGIYTGRPSFAKKRIYAHDFEAILAGRKPVMDFAKRTALYDFAFNKALADRKLINALHDVKMPDGRPAVDIAGAARGVEGINEGEHEALFVRPQARRGFHPTNEMTEEEIEKARKADRHDYKQRDYAPLRKNKWVDTEEASGTKTFLYGDAIIHPKVIRYIDAIFKPSAVKKSGIGRFALGAGATVKGTALDLSMFHPVQLTVHGLEHRTLEPWTEGMARVMGKELTKINLKDPDQRGLVRGGMQIVNYQSPDLFREGLAGSSLTRHVPWAGPRVVAFTDWLFNDWIPRLKMRMALHALERNKERYTNPLMEENRAKYPDMSEPELHELTAKQIYKITADQADAAFGELNWEMMGINRTMQDALRIGLLAPDFLFARGKFVGQALRGIRFEEGKGIKGMRAGFGLEQMQALMGINKKWIIGVGAVTNYILARILNKFISGEYHWEAKNAFSIIYNGRAYSLRTVHGDILHMATDFPGFWYNRLNPVFGRTIMEAAYSRDQFGRHRNAMEQIQDLAGSIVPITVRGMLKGKEQKWWESFLNAFGVTEHRNTALDNLYRLVQDFKKANNIADPSERIYDPEKDPYRGIKLASLYYNPNAVADEIRKGLKAKKFTIEELGRHFKEYNRPFTGSNKNEQLFYFSLDDEKRRMYQDAVNERQRMIVNLEEGYSIYKHQELGY